MIPPTYEVCFKDANHLISRPLRPLHHHCLEAEPLN